MMTKNTRPKTLLSFVNESAAVKSLKDLFERLSEHGLELGVDYTYDKKKQLLVASNGEMTKEIADALAGEYDVTIDDNYVVVESVTNNEFLNEANSDVADDTRTYSDVIVMIKADNRILLMKRDASDNKNLSENWSLPGGKAKLAEDSHTAAKRELFEEAGIEAAVEDLKFMSTFTNQDGSNSNVFLLILPEEPKVTLSNEHTEYKFLTIKEAQALDTIYDTTQRLNEIYDALFEDKIVTESLESYEEISDILSAIKKSKRASWKLWLKSLAKIGMSRQQMVDFVIKCGYRPTVAERLVDKHIEDDAEQIARSAMAGAEDIEVVINEAKIGSDAEFKDYAENVLKQAHGDNYDQEIADKTISDLLEKYGEDYGASVGALTSNFGE